ncbi:MAG: chemotaxis protein CheW [Proteobacteria bacterium]|nr:MAG: chemotaxis protein CheW [Pseudomonadota bacterium]PIE17449.1 MAG: chemotaxis protein CheW [Pseudomonadota bacterium]
MSGTTGVDLVIFRVGELLCGIDIGSVQEVNKQLDVTPVHQARETIRGIVNLRGQILTILDLRRCLGLPSQEIDQSSRSVVVRHQDEIVGLLVDEVDDIVSAQADTILPPPPHLRGAYGDLFEGVYRQQHRLVAVLGVERLWTNEPTNRSN